MLTGAARPLEREGKENAVSLLEKSGWGSVRNRAFSEFPLFREYRRNETGILRGRGAAGAVRIVDLQRDRSAGNLLHGALMRG